MIDPEVTKLLPTQIRYRYVTGFKPKNQLTKNILSLTSVQIATYVLPLISVPVISRIIGPQNFGIINFGAAYVTYFTLIVSYTFDFTATRKIAQASEDEAARNQIFSDVFYSQCLLLLVSTIIFGASLYFLPQLQHNRRILLLSYLICFGLLFTQNWLYQGLQDLSKIAYFTLASRLLFTVCILLVVHTKEDYFWQPLLIGSIQIAVGLFSFFYAIKTYRLRFLPVSLKRSLKVLYESRVVFLSLIFVNLYSTTNTFILGMYQTSDQVGFYTAGQRLIIIAQSVLSMPIAQAFYPFVGKSFGESKEQGLKVIHKLVPILVLVLGAASILMFFLGPYVITLFYGDKFAPAIAVFKVLAIVPLLFSLNNVFGIQVMLNNKMDTSFFTITAIGGIFSVLLNIWIVKQWGYMGSAFNWLATESLILICMLIVLKSKGFNPVNPQYFRLSSMKSLFNGLTGTIGLKR